MRSFHKLAACALLVAAVPAAATLPMPSPAAAPQDAQAFLFNAGASDIFEIVTGQMAFMHAANPAVRSFGSMMIGDHTNTTNSALATAMAAGVMPPPPELSPMQKDMVGQLMAAAPANFDRVYLGQQMAAHGQALALMQGYSRRGDVPALRQAAASTVPLVTRHIAQIRQLMASTR